MKTQHNMYGIALLLALICAHTSVLRAELNDSKSLLLDELISTWDQQNTPNQIISQIQETYLKRLNLEVIPASYQQHVKDYKSDLKTLLKNTQYKMLSSEAVKQYYLEYYSEAELIDLIRFYQSELGQKLLQAQPPFVDPEERRRQAQERADAIDRLTDHFLFQLRQDGFDADFIDARATTPMQAIEYSEMLKSAGFDGVFKFEIKAANIHNNYLYINSEEDYRDRRCLTVRIKPELVSEFTNRYGENVSEALVGRSLMVKGTARRQVIRAIGPDHKPTFPYYQTHIVVEDLTQLIISANETSH